MSLYEVINVRFTTGFKKKLIFMYLFYCFLMEFYLISTFFLCLYFIYIDSRGIES